MSDEPKAEEVGTSQPPSEGDWKPTVPPEVALGDEMLRAAHEASDLPLPDNEEMERTSATTASAHYLRQIALVLTDLLSLLEHQHLEHGEHARRAKAEERARVERIIRAVGRGAMRLDTALHAVGIAHEEEEAHAPD